MAEDTVTLNLAVTSGAGVAVWKDAASREHQEVILQTQLASADPVSVSTANPMPVGGNVADGTADAGNSVKVGAVFHAAPITLTDGQRGSLQADASGFLKVNVAAGGAAGGTSSAVAAAAPGVATAVGFSDGTNMRLGLVDGSGNIKVNIAAGGVPAGVDGAAFTANVTNGLPSLFAADNVNGLGAVVQGNLGVAKMTLDRKVWVAMGAAISGGFTPYKLICGNTTNSNRIKASAGQVGSINIFNGTGGTIFIKFYDKGSAAPTVGTDVPVHTYGMGTGGNITITPTPGIQFVNGIGIATTLNAADGDSTVIPTGAVINVDYA